MRSQNSPPWRLKKFAICKRPIPGESKKDVVEYLMGSTMKNKVLNIEIKDRVYKLKRLSDKQYIKLRKNSISIIEDYDHLMSLEIDNKLIYSSYPKMYVALKKFFGDSGRLFDSWKGSFSFPFLISFQNEMEDFEYILRIYNFRTSIEFKIGKVIHTKDKNLDKLILYKPFREFSKNDINRVISFLVKYLTEYFKTIESEYDTPFFCTVDSNLILFGYKNKIFFEDQFITENKYAAAIEKLKLKGVPLEENSRI